MQDDGEERRVKMLRTRDGVEGLWEEKSKMGMRRKGRLSWDAEENKIEGGCNLNILRRA